MRRRGHSEDGYVIIVVLALLVVGLALGAVALAEALHSNSYANRDARSRRALQATDAGIQSELYRQQEAKVANGSYNLNGGPLGLSTLLDCIVPQLNSGLQVTGVVALKVNAAGVCPPQADSGGNPQTTSVTVPLGNHAYEQSEFIPGATTVNGGAQRVLFPKIVSLAWDDNGRPSDTTHIVYQRQESVLAPVSALQVLEAQGNLSVSGLSVLGASVLGTANGDISAGGNLSTGVGFVVANLSSGLLGTVSYGGTYSGGLTVPLPVKTTTPIVRQPVSVASSKLNCVLAGTSVNNCAGLGGAYSAATNSVTQSSGTLTLAAGDYVFCNFNVTGGTVNASPTNSTPIAPVRIFIDNPNSTRCKGKGGSQGNFTASTGITNGLLGLSGIVASSGVQIYVVGDGNTTNPYDNATTVSIGTKATCVVVCSNPVTQAMVVYAPTSAVTLNTGVCLLGPLLCAGGVFEGSIIGDNVTASATTFTQDLDLGNYPLYNGVEVFHPVQYIQCSPLPNKAGTTYTALQQDPTIDLTGC